MTLVLLALLVAAATQPGATAAATPMFDADGLRGWTAGRTKPDCVRNVSGTVSVAQCADWLRTETGVFGDYIISFAIRARDADSRGWLGLLGMSDVKGRPVLTLALPLLASPDAPKHSPVRVEMLFFNADSRAAALNADGDWQSYIVTRNRSGIHVLLNGRQLLSSGSVHASDGWIGFLAQGTGFEVRDVRLRHLFPPSQLTGTGLGLAPGSLVNGIYRPGDGIVLPRLVREVRPNYTREALAAHIEGIVVLECVVRPDGVPDRITVIRSLDDRLGLDN